MNKTTALFLMISPAMLNAPLGCSQLTNKPLNVVIIYVDDMGWKDLECYGSTFYETPNIDRLARKGVRFTDAYAACNVCAPSHPAGARLYLVPRREVKWVNPEIADMPGLQHHILHSENLGHEVGYVVWTPDGYSEKTKKRYPVIYFIHGSGGNETSDAAGFSGLVKQAIAEKTIPPVICVFPNGGRTGYRNEGEKMIIEELIPEVDMKYRTVAKAKSRALAGFSMGGGGSVYLAIRYPELFCAAASMGGGLRNQDGEMDDAIEKAIPVWKKNKFGFFLVNGDQDRPEAFKDFSALLEKEGIANEVIILPDANHSLKIHYFPRSGSKLVEFIGKHIKK